MLSSGEALLGVDAPAAPKCGMEDLLICRRAAGFGHDHDHLGVGTALVEEATHGNEVEHLPHIPLLDKTATEIE